MEMEERKVIMNIENLKKAKNIVSDLANGVHPYTKESLGFEQIVVQDERIVQWLNFVAEQLNDIIIQKEKKHNDFLMKYYKSGFKISKQELKNFVFTDQPITITEITRRLNEIANNDIENELHPINLNLWLQQNELLNRIDTPYGKLFQPTGKGVALGIKAEERSFEGKAYISITYKKQAQKYIVDHLLRWLKK